MRYIIVGTAGHIDHGKSALVKALTGTDPDRLKEEKLRGITIDLGFAHLDLGDAQVGFVDVPGHERFVKNMLAGVGGIDFVILVVAADESIMPQTREHFEICRMLRITAGIVVITKIDLVDSDLVELVRCEIRDAVRGSFLDGAPILPVSSKTGAGLQELHSALHQLALTVRQKPADQLLRLPIDRAFTVRGFGTVVTGTLSSGQIRKDQEVELIPGGFTARVRGVQVYGRTSERAIAGQRTAVNLQGVDLNQVVRGLNLTVPGIFEPTQLLDVRLDLLTSAPLPLKNLVKVRFHQGTAEVLARVALLGKEALPPGDSAYAQLRLDTPAWCLHGDAFIVRQFSPAVTIGGGKVLDPHPVKHKITDSSVSQTLRALDSAKLEEQIPLLLASRRRQSLTLKELDGLYGLPESNLQGICQELARSGVLQIIPAPSPILVLPDTLRDLQDATIDQVEEFHRRNPLQKGISREELRKRVYDSCALEIFRFCLDDLVEQKRISLQGEIVSLHGREIRLSEEGEQVRRMIEAVFRQSAYQPPPFSEIPSVVSADAAEVRRISFWMLKERILVKVGEDLAYHRQTLEEIKQKIRSSYPPGSKFGVAEFKELFDLTRKHAIPLLEYLDRERFTKREGNERVLL